MRPCGKQRRTDVGSSGKRRTTFTKLNRESKLRDKRAEKQARKAARKVTMASEVAETAAVAEVAGTAAAELDAGVPGGGSGAAPLQDYSATTS
jgi:hypothetical protein